MSINIRDFVSVNITREQTFTSNRGTMVAYLSNSVRRDLNKAIDDFVYFSMNDVIRAIDEDGIVLYPESSDVYEACRVFFDCGGRSILLINVDVDITNPSTANETYLNAIEKLPYNIIAFGMKVGGIEISREDENEEEQTIEFNGGFIHIAPPTSEEITSGIPALASLLESFDTLKGTAYRKLVSFDIPTMDFLEDEGRSINIMYKLGGKDPASHMSILAYLSRVDVEDPSSIADYCFTREPLLTPAENNVNWRDVGEVANITLDIFNGVPTNFGGNTGAGTDIVEELMTIKLAQDIIMAQVGALKTKLNTSNAVARIHSVLVSVIGRYSDAGWLTSGTFEGDNIIVKRNGQTFPIITRGEAITGGYRVVILPLNSRTQSEVAKRALSDVHLIFNTSKGIRYLNNIGKVF